MLSGQRTTCSLSCQNSCSLAWSRKGKLRTWCTKMYLRIGSSESSGATSPRSDLNGAPKRCRAVGEANSEISHLTCWEMSSLLRSTVFSQKWSEGSDEIRTVLLLSRQNGAFGGYGSVRGAGAHQTLANQIWRGIGAIRGRCSLGKVIVRRCCRQGVWRGGNVVWHGALVEGGQK